MAPEPGAGGRGPALEPAPEQRLEFRPPGPPAGQAVFSLALLGGVAAAVVGAAWLLTRAPIQANEDRVAQARIDFVLPPARYDNEPFRDRVLLPVDGPDEPLRAVYRARLGGAPGAAVLTTVSPAGYGGPIRLLVGIRADGTVTGAQAISHAETPGIGDFIAGPTPFMAAFTGRSATDPELSRWRVDDDGGDFDAVTGATITSRAAVAGVRQAVQYFADHREAVFSTPATAPAAPSPAGDAAAARPAPASP